MLFVQALGTHSDCVSETTTHEVLHCTHIQNIPMCSRLGFSVINKRNKKKQKNKKTENFKITLNSFHLLFVCVCDDASDSDSTSRFQCDDRKDKRKEKWYFVCTLSINSVDKLTLMYLYVYGRFCCI